MRVGIYPGSFDPITLGHLDIIKRASYLVDNLIVAVLRNSAKNPLFSEQERVNMIKEVVGDFENIQVEAFEGLLVDFARDREANVIVRGLRAITDFEYELQIAQTNQKLCPEIDTIFLTTNLEYSYLSSSLVKEIAQYGADVSQFVPNQIIHQLKEQLHVNV